MELRPLQILNHHIKVIRWTVFREWTLVYFRITFPSTKLIEAKLYHFI